MAQGAEVLERAVFGKLLGLRVGPGQEECFFFFLNRGKSHLLICKLCGFLCIQTLQKNERERRAYAMCFSVAHHSPAPLKGTGWGARLMAEQKDSVMQGPAHLDPRRKQ